MKFRLISHLGVDEGTGEIADAFGGRVFVLVWKGRTFKDAGHVEDDIAEFHEVLGQALDPHQVTPPPKVDDRWTSPTAIGRMAEKAPDVVDSVAPGYVYLSNPAPESPFKPIGEQEGRPSAYMDGGPIPDCDKPDQVSWIVPPRRRRGEPS